MSKSPLKKGLGMVLWQGFARGGAFFASVWAARCLSTDRLGISTMVTATITQIALLIILNQNNALVREYRGLATDEEKASLVSKTVSFRMFAAVLFAVIMGAYVLLLKPEGGWAFAILVGLPLLLVECNQPAWLLQALEIPQISQQLEFLKVLIMVVGYAIFLRPGAAAGTELALTSVGAVAASLWAWRRALRGIRVKISWEHALAYRHQIWAGRWLFVAGLANYLYTQSYVAQVGYFISVSDAAVFRVGNSLAMQLTILTVVGQQILYPKFIDLQRRDPGELKALQRRIVRWVLGSALPVGVVLLFFADDFIRLLYGPRFLGAGPIFTVLAVTRFFAAAASVYAFGLWAKQQDRRMAFTMIGLAVVSLALSASLIKPYGLNGAAATALLSEVASLGLTWFVARG